MDEPDRTSRSFVVRQRRTVDRRLGAVFFLRSRLVAPDKHFVGHYELGATSIIGVARIYDWGILNFSIANAN